MHRGIVTLHRGIYPAPPVSVADLTTAKNNYIKELEYLIIAVNKAGEGEPSDTEMVVL